MSQDEKPCWHETCYYPMGHQYENPERDFDTCSMCVCFEDYGTLEHGGMCFWCANEIEKTLIQEQIEIRAIESEMRDLVS